MSGESLSWPPPGPRAGRWAPPPIGQGLAVIAVVIAALVLTAIGIGAYLVSLRIAGAHAENARLEHRLAERRADLRGLGREYEIRSRMGELDRWRGDLDLHAVSLGQTVRRGDAILAAVRMREAALADAAAEAKPVDAPAHPGYPRTARASLDDLVAEVASR